MGDIVDFFFGSHVFDFRTSGIMLHFPDGTHVRLFATLSMFTQDGGAHKSMWHCKGDAGSKFCMLCRNLFAEKKSELVVEDGTDLLTCSAMRRTELDFATDAVVRGAVRRLAANHAIEPPGSLHLA